MSETINRMQRVATALQHRAAAAGVDALRTRYLIEATPRHGYWLAVMVGVVVIARRVMLLEALEGLTVEIPHTTNAELLARLLNGPIEGIYCTTAATMRSAADIALRAGEPCRYANATVDAATLREALAALETTDLFAARVIVERNGWLVIVDAQRAELVCVRELDTESGASTEAAPGATPAPAWPRPARVSPAHWTPALRAARAGEVAR